MKKFVCIFVIMMILSSSFCVNASSYDCKPIIGLDATKNVIDLEFTLDDNMPNDRFMIALYIGGKLDKLYHYSFDEIKDMVDANEDIEEAKDKNYISLEIDKTPDTIKVFAWDDGFIPVCKELSLFETDDDLIAANKIVKDELQAVKDILHTLRWKDKKFSYDSEYELCDLLLALSNDALKRDDELLFTRDNAQEFYSQDIDDIRVLYSSMTSIEKDHFMATFKGIGRVKFAHVEYLINFLGIKHMLAGL